MAPSRAGDKPSPDRGFALGDDIWRRTSPGRAPGHRLGQYVSQLGVVRTPRWLRYGQRRIDQETQPAYAGDQRVIGRYSTAQTALRPRQTADQWSRVNRPADSRRQQAPVASRGVLAVRGSDIKCAMVWQMDWCATADMRGRALAHGRRPEAWNCSFITWRPG